MTPTKTRTPDQLAAELAAPFPPQQVKWRKGARGMLLPYITAAAVIQRLNEVLGIDGWRDQYWLQANGSVVCQLRVRVGDHWISRQDVGSPSQQDATKGAYSDALKRTARKLGVGLYLVDLDRKTATENDKTSRRREVSPAPTEAANGQAAKPKMPQTGEELERRLADYDGKLASLGLCMDGDLLMHVSNAVAKAGHGLDVRQWNSRAIKLAVDVAMDYEAGLRAKATQRQGTGKEAKHA
jgi:hypothetical protein